jgi:hypothetical protein
MMTPAATFLDIVAAFSLLQYKVDTYFLIHARIMARSAVFYWYMECHMRSTTHLSACLIEVM